MRRSRLFLAPILIALIASIGCGGEQHAPAPLQTPAAKPTPSSAQLLSRAEASYLPSVSPALADLVRGQPWFQAMTPAHMELILAMQKCDRASQIKGERASVAEILRFATEQAWYTDGLDEREALGLSGVFEAYAASLSDDHAPPIGPILASTVREGLFDIVDLKETGRVVVLISAADANLGRQALALARDSMPRVEALVGAFPYQFLHIQVTDDLPEIFAGVSYDQFIALSTDYVDASTLIHELTHSTLYGIFPIWLEEGLAHFNEYYLTGTLDQGTRDFQEAIVAIRADPRLRIGVTRSQTFHGALSERAQGFLFVKALYDFWGIDSLSQLVRSLRTRTLTDQELLSAIAAHSPAEQRHQFEAFLCQNVVGAVHNYCVPGR
jgi:hypothetical protein